MSDHEGVISGAVKLVGASSAFWREQAQDMERQRDEAFAEVAALRVSVAGYREALTRLVDADMGLRDQIPKWVPSGGNFLAVRGILAVQQAKNVLAADPAAHGAAVMEAVTAAHKAWLAWKTASLYDAGFDGQLWKDVNLTQMALDRALGPAGREDGAP